MLYSWGFKNSFIQLLGALESENNRFFIILLFHVIFKYFTKVRSPIINKYRIYNVYCKFLYDLFMTMIKNEHTNI